MNLKLYLKFMPLQGLKPCFFNESYLKPLLLADHLNKQ